LKQPLLRFALPFLLLAAAAGPLRAHGGRAHHDEVQPATATTSTTEGPRDWHELWRTWGLELGVLIPLVISAVWYAAGLRRLWRKAGRGHGVSVREAACFTGGMFALFVALVSPLHPWGNVLFSAHMAQHEILMLVAAPLLVLGRPVVAFLTALPASWARRLGHWSRVRWFAAAWGFLTLPLVAWLVHAVVLWAWHIPVLFQATLTNEFVHALQHLSFLLSALLFWWAIVHGDRRAAGYGVAVLFLFTTALHSGALGALLTFAERVWYPAYSGTTASWGLTPLEDQQLGGLIMWVPACAVYIVAGLVLFAGWLSSSEASVRKQEAVRAEARAL
jgi:putative membrane protein